MKEISSAQIRQMFLDFFKEKGHQIEPSASLIPFEDPSLLWINSGVSTLKKYFDGRIIPENPRIVNAQKCIRTNDIENVGVTARHHTFFEMMGNFSIGDYFREEAVTWGWELLTSPKWVGFEKNKLYVTVYPGDQETVAIWTKLGLTPEQIIPLEGNFWEIGEGPCGPCTEIFYDRGKLYDPENIGLRLLSEDLENDRYVEVWNIVFSQFNAMAGVSRDQYPELPNKNIDTGMGLERMVCILQEGKTNFDTDLFLPIIKVAEQVSGKQYQTSSLEMDVAFKVIADHCRTVCFAVADGALPSNEGRGYILRRLIRRAVRYAKKLGIERPFMYELTPVVADIMAPYYPNIKEKTAFIQKVIRGEEERFHETLHAGLDMLTKIIADQKATDGTQISGKDAFRLYDTFGFPIELTEEYCLDEQMTIDRVGFVAEMESQRLRAQTARKDVETMQIQGGVLGEIRVESEFVGYQLFETEAKIICLLNDKGELIDSADAGEIQVLLDKTPFYAESGGQKADIGLITNGDHVAEVIAVKKAPNGQHLHLLKIISGSFSDGDTVTATINADLRKNTIKNHTATHLLHQALKEIVGTHVNQAGSLVQPERLRFDFSHFGPVTSEELERLEQLVNEKIWASYDVVTTLKCIEEAKAMGAMALFDEKYGKVVRVVEVGDYSLELCGGCHVSNSSEIGLFKIISESGIGAGTRRIEAVTGKVAYEYLSEQVGFAKTVAAKLKTRINEIPEKVELLQRDYREVQRENESLKAKLGNIEASLLEKKAVDIKGVTVLVTKVNASDMNALRNMTDELKQKLPSAVIVLGSAADGKVNLVASVSADYVKQGYHAGKIIKEVATACGGSGGGRPDMAQAGGKEPAKLDAALAIVASLI